MRGGRRSRTVTGMRVGRAFSDKVAIVTGGASGIGRSLGAELVNAGACVVLADIDGEGVCNAAASLDAGSGRTRGVELDVRDACAFQDLVDAVATEHGCVDLLFNNAGIVMGGETHTFDLAHWRRVFDVNMQGVVNGVAAAYPRMVEQGHGHIVNTASTAGLAPAVFVAAYTASKHAVVGLSLALRPEAAGRGVRVSVLCPGAVDTPILDAGAPADLPPESGRSLSGREYMAVAGLRLMDPDVVARRALAGVASNRSVIVVPGSARAVWWLNRLSPAAFDGVGRILARRVARAMDASDVEAQAVAS